MITITYMPERVAQKDLMHLGTEFAKFAEPSAGSLGLGVAARDTCTWTTDL